jgi:hypothetical protein
MEFGNLDLGIPCMRWEVHLHEIHKQCSKAFCSLLIILMDFNPHLSDVRYPAQTHPNYAPNPKPQPKFRSIKGIIQFIISPSCTELQMELPRCRISCLSKHLQSAQLCIGPRVHSSTPMISNFSPSSLNGSFPNVGHELLTPFSNESSSHRP